MAVNSQQGQQENENPWRQQGRGHGGHQGRRLEGSRPLGEQHEGGQRGDGQQGAGQQGAGGQGDGQLRAGQLGAGGQGAGQQGTGQQEQRAASRARPALWCHFQDRCNRRDSCKFQHYDQGFRQRSQGQTRQ